MDKYSRDLTLDEVMYLLEDIADGSEATEDDELEGIDLWID